MNYGPNGVNNNAVVASDKLSLHVTEIAVAHFNSAVGRTQETIDRLDVGRAADITRKVSWVKSLVFHSPTIWQLSGLGSILDTDDTASSCILSVSKIHFQRTFSNGICI